MTGTDGDPPERPVGRLTPKQAAKRAKYQESEARRDIRRLAKKHRSRPRRWLVRFAKIVVWFVCLVTVGIVILAVLDPQPASTTTSTFAPVVTVGSATTRPRPSTTTTAAPTAHGLAEECFSFWSGNHRGFVDEVKAVLNDPGSMEVHGTYFNSNDSPADGIRIRMDYSAANAFGGMVRGNALADMRMDCSISVIQYE